MLNPKVMKKWCLKLRIPDWGKVDEVKSRLERSLAVMHMDAYLMECDACGFQAPDVPGLDSCPGCGADFAADEDQPEEGGDMQQAAATTTNNVTPLSAKQAKQKEDKERRDAAGKMAEADARKKLTAIEKKIDGFRADAGRIEWNIGKHLKEIYDRDLWQASDDYKSFEEYVKSRFDFTRQTARAFMLISEHFTREEASEIPLTHLRLLVSIPDEKARREMVDLAKEQDLTCRELAAQVKAKRAELGLDTQRAGMEDTVLVNVRLKPGVVAEAEWKKVRGKAGKRNGRFQLGDNTFVVEDLGDEGFVVKLQKPKKS